MTLENLCLNISKNDPNILGEDHPIGSRIICPEYSIYVEDKKTYPHNKNEQIFALCWVTNSESEIYGTIKPSPISFSYITNFRDGSRTQMHTHEYLELAYVVSGTFHQNIHGRDITFQKGDLCLIDKNCLHQDYLNAEPASIIFIGIVNEIFDSIINSQIADEQILSFLQTALLKQKNLWQYLHFRPISSDNNKMEGYFIDLLTELINYDNASKYICHGLLMRIFHLLSTNYDISLSTEMQKKMNWLIFEDITSYIKDNYQNISIKELANKFHFQEDYFNRLLKSTVGVTYSKYLQEIRINEAIKLLLNTNLTIEEISIKVGYQNKGYFYKLFKEKTKMTPSEYRKIKAYVMPSS